MPDTKWTPAQAAAIEDRGGTLLVSAAAGSGKTAVLVERAVGLILDEQAPVEADRLLILTFTKAAAAELRARIAGRLTEEVQKDPRNARLRRQKMLLQRAPIGTIDSFCLDLLRRNFAALEIPPDFSPAEEGGLQQLRDEALNETMEQAVQSPDFCAFADLYGRGRTDAAAGNTILQVYEFLQALPNPEATLAVWLSSWQTPGSFAASGWAKLLCGDAARLCRESAALAQKALPLLREDLEQARAEAEAAKKTPAAKASAVAKENERFAEPLSRMERADETCQAAAAAAAAGWQPLYEFFAPWRGETPQPLPGLKGMPKRLAGEHKAVIKALADRLADNFAKAAALVPCSEAEAEQDRVTAAPMLAALGDAVRDFSARYYAKKIEHKVLDFSDFEHLALKLLQNPDGTRTALCATICAGFDAVMVDEYQDTNALQDALYRSLAKPSGDNLFFVGDLKQSIYRFRQADPAVFCEKQESFPPLPGQKARPRPESAGQSAALALDANFRSAPAVVDGINFLFEALMRPTLGGVAYGPGQALVCGVPGTYPGKAEAHVLRTAERPGDAAWIAQRIRRMLDEAYPVREGTGTRPLRCEDCCILLTTRGWFGAYEKALEAVGIPVYADTADDLLSAPQMRPLIALLRTIDNPSQNIELAAAMRSALFGFSDDDLLRLRAAQKQRSLYGALVAAAQSDAQDAFWEKCRAFSARLGALRRLSRSIPVDELLEEIFASTGYLAAVGAGPNGARRRDEVRRFSAWAATAGAGGLSALIRAIDATEAAGGRMDAAPGKSKPGCVSIMTIHRSKGLQFPVVFLADTAHAFNLEDSKNAVLLHRTLGIGLSLRTPAGWYPTAARLALRRQAEQETRSEEMRLLYVAATRAQDYLILTIPLEKPENALARLAPCLYAGAAEGALASAGQFSTWLLAALLQHPAGGALREAAGLRELPCRATESAWEITLEDAPETAETAERRPEQPASPPDTAMVETIEDSFAWQYPAAAETEIPAKVSVTAVVHKSEATTLERPGFLSAAGMTAAEKGTALHTFLEHADFAALAAAKRQGEAALEAALSAEAARQLAQKLTDPETAQQLDFARLRAFVESEAFARITAAEQVLREYDFITGLPASAVLAAQQYAQATGQAPADDMSQDENAGPQADSAAADVPREAHAGPQDKNAELSCAAAQSPAAEPTVLVQGIADVVLVFADHVEILDYKTDRRKTEAELLAAYRPQLNLYARAVARRFDPKPVTYKGIYSFSLGRLIEA
ncbi:MAG: UvrD-helicase domain-containing protein [Faecalibacterium sp.]|nr:UvrD-helicase domain-containing protein [Faecalibacterium sp.]